MIVSPLKTLVGCLMVAGVLLCVVALQHMVAGQEFSWHFTPDLFVVALIGAFGALYGSSYAWKEFVFALSAHRLSFAQAFHQVGILLVGKYIPGMIGGIVARVMANSGRISANAVVEATLLEQCGSMAAVTLVGSACLAGAWNITAGLSIFLLGLVAAGVAPTVAEPLLQLMFWVRARFWNTEQLTVTDADKAGLRRAWLAQVALHVCIALYVAVVIRALLPYMPLRDILELTGAYGISLMIGVLAFIAPGGIGVREGCFVVLSAHVVGYEQALVIALALRLAMTSIDLLAGLGIGVNWIIHVIIN